MRIFIATLLVLGALLVSAVNGCAQNKITASVTVTNATINGVVLSVNGTPRTFTNNVVNSSTQVLTNNDVTGNGSKTNLLTQIQLSPFAQVVSVDTGSNSFNLIGNAGVPMVATLTAGYGRINYSTQTVSSVFVLQGPNSALPTAQARTNNASGVVSGINAPEATNTISQVAPAAAELLGKTNTQTISGVKTFNNTNNAFWGTFNGNLNDVNQNPMVTRSGSDTTLSDTNGNPRIIIAADATTIQNPGGVFGNSATIGSDSVTIGQSSLGLLYIDGTQIALKGVGATNRFYADGTSLALNDAIGDAILQSDSTSTRIYDPSGAVQVTVDTSGITVTNAVIKTNLNVGGSVVVSGGVRVFGPQTNASFTGTNNFPSGADVAFGRYALSTLGNGINQDIVPGTNVFVEVSGPTGAFSIEGIAGGRDGKFLILVNQTGQNMTIATEGGATGNDPTPANRIISMTGADRVTVGNGVATLIYSGASSRWLLIAFDP